MSFQILFYFLEITISTFVRKHSFAIVNSSGQSIFIHTMVRLEIIRTIKNDNNHSIPNFLLKFRNGINIFFNRNTIWNVVFLQHSNKRFYYLLVLSREGNIDCFRVNFFLFFCHNRFNICTAEINNFPQISQNIFLQNSFCGTYTRYAPTPLYPSPSTANSSVH